MKRKEYGTRAVSAAVLAALVLTAGASAAAQEDAGDERIVESTGTAVCREEDSTVSVDAGPAGSTDFTVTHYEVTAPGLGPSVRLVLLADLHITAPGDPDVSAGKQEDLAGRTQLFQAPTGIGTADLWQGLAGALDAMDADMILLCGDLIDYDTPATTGILKKGLDSLNTPWMYVRADHDYGNWYSAGIRTQEQAIEEQEKVERREKIMSSDLGAVRVIGWDNSCYPLTDEGAARLQSELEEAKKQGDHVVFLSHVPLRSLKDDRLYGTSVSRWDGKALLWGEDCRYVPEGKTKEALDAVLSDDSPVDLVLSGHLHFPYLQPLTDRTAQIVAAPAFEGKLTEITFRTSPQDSGD